VEDEHAQVSSIVTTRTEIPGTTTYHAASRQRGSLVQLVKLGLYLTIAVGKNAETFIFLKFNISSHL